MDSAWAYGIVPKSEPGVEALSEWLSGALRRHKGTRWGIWGGFVGGSSGVAGGVTGAIVGASGGHINGLLVAVPWLIWMTFVASMSLWLKRSLQSSANAELWGRDSTRTITMLVNARSRGRLKAAVGDAYAEQLNEGAKLALRCRGLLDSPALAATGDGSVWSRTAERVRNSMNGAMVRLMVLATNHADEHELAATVADMRAIVDELAESERRHRGLATDRSGRSAELRSTLEELRELTRAEQEALNELRARG